MYSVTCVIQFPKGVSVHEEPAEYKEEVFELVRTFFGDGDKKSRFVCECRDTIGRLAPGCFGCFERKNIRVTVYRRV